MMADGPFTLAGRTTAGMETNDQGAMFTQFS